MSVTTTQKALDLSRTIADKLTLRLKAPTANGAPATPGTIVQSFDANGNPVLTLTLGVGDGSGNHVVQAVVQIAPIASIESDALGLAQPVYTPHVVNVAFDSNASYPTAESTKLMVLGETLRLGAKTALYEADPGSSNIAIATITATNLIATFDDYEWPLLGSM